MPVINTEVQLSNVSVEVEFEVFCACGNGLCNQSDMRYSYGRSFPQVVVEPCQSCLDRAREEGYDQGHKDGYEEATSA